MKVQEAYLEVVNDLGLHARAAVKLVVEANKFDSYVMLSREGTPEVNAKSIMGVLTLAAGKGSVVKVRCEGDDAEEALEALRGLFRSGFEDESQAKEKPGTEAND